MKHSAMIAIVGMDGIFPGAPTIDRLWDNIVNGIDQSKPVPDSRWVAPKADRLCQDLTPDRTYSPCACLIDDFDFDPHDFALPPDLTRQLDPVHQLTLTAGKRAISGCVTQPVDKNRVDTILAAIALPTDGASRFSRSILGPYIESRLAAPPKTHPAPVGPEMSLASRVDGLPAALLAAEMGFGGDSFTLDAACASSIYAIKLACDALVNGRADMVVSGGVSRPECLYTQTGFSQLQALSPSGRCAPFDRLADGLVVGEGVGIVVLKRLSDAIDHGDSIHGLIHGIGLSNDMRGNLLAPEQNGQVRAMQMAYRIAGWRPSDVDLIECHGTGTRAGDTTEIASLMELWRSETFDPGMCAIGSVKSMIGHLLTAAGAAGLIKTLLAIKHRILPPSIHFDSPPPDSPLPDSPFRVQKNAEDWPDRGDRQPRRAAVSAFGFGGINAHLLIEEWDPRSSQPTLGRPSIAVNTRVTAPDDQPVAIVGMDVRVGALTGLPAFERAVLSGISAIGKRPRERWKGANDAVIRQLGGIDPRGAYLQAIDLEIGEFQIPPKEMDAILPQQLLVLKTGAGALADAGMPLREARERMGAIIGIGFDFEATNFHLRWQLAPVIDRFARANGLDPDADEVEAWLESARDACGPPLTAPRVMGALGGIVASRMARECRFGGPSFVVSADSASGIKALGIAVDLIRQNVVDAMLVGAVDLFAEGRSVIRHQRFVPFSPRGRIRSFDADADGTLAGDGAAAMVLKPLSRARADGDRIYAVINGIGSAGGAGGDLPGTGRITAGTLRRSLSRCLSQNQRKPDTLGYIEAQGTGDPARDGVELSALSACFSEAGHDPEKPDAAIALGAKAPICGYLGAADGLVSVVKTALCLYRRVLPPLAGYTRSGSSIPLPFHMPRQSQPWYRNREDGPRCAVSSAVTMDGTCAHVLLEEADRPDDAAAVSPFVTAGRECGLFVVTGVSSEMLLEGLGQLNHYLAQTVGEVEIETSAARWMENHPARPEHRLAVAMVVEADDPTERIIEKACQSVRSGESATISGQVFYTPDPMGAHARVAMVYPGSGNHYLGMGRDLALRFPDVVAAMDRETTRLKTQQRPWSLMPWRSDWSAGWERDAGTRLNGDILNMIFAQVVYGDLMTRVLKRVALRTDALIGYSLGESAALFAHGVWADRGQMLARMQSTDLFTEQIAGPCRSLRSAWGLSEGEPVDWRVAVLNRPADQVKAAIPKTDPVRLLIVNTDHECVIGGLAPAVARTIERLGCQAVYLDGVVTVHCDAAQPVADAYRALHHFPTTTVNGLDVYSCSFEKAYSIDDDSIADSIKKQAVEGFNYANTIRQARADGIRVFVEAGPRGSCTRMIDRILSDEPHLAVAANHGPDDEWTALLRCLARLTVERVPLDLSALYAGATRADGAVSIRDASPVVTLPVGGAPLVSEPPAMPRPDPAGRPAPDTAIGDPIAGEDDSYPAVPPQAVHEGPERLFTTLLDAADENMTATAEAHEQFLAFAQTLTREFADAFDLQNQLIATGARAGVDDDARIIEPAGPKATDTEPIMPVPTSRQVAFDRDKCMAFAVGRVGDVLGPAFDVVDTYRVRVRLPDEPLMLVDRILSVDGEMLSMTSGRVVTEHDVLPDAWYLDGGRAPVCISVEAGQADLFLSAYLGIDHQVKGERAYRLLDAVVTFHRGLPRPGETIRYEIAIDRFVRQGDTWMFFFRFEGYIDGEHLITMRDGCAGFFTEAEVNNSGGIILTATERQPVDGRLPEDWQPPVPMARESYSDEQVDALRRGDLAACFGDAFTGIALSPSLWLPGGRMRLIQRILDLDPHGGRYGLGMIRAEADIHPDDWFLTCHFVDDMVMPGTLMYECCAHTLRVFLQRMGWVSDRAAACYEPVIGNAARLKCRGPVTPKTRHVHYEIQISEIGYGPEPYVVADAHMSADGRPIVFFKDMSMKMTGVDREHIRTMWQADNADGRHANLDHTTAPLFDQASILAFAIGRPSEAFGEPYRVFDDERVIARLPGPPYCFMDRVVQVEPEPWRLEPGGWVTAEYDVPSTAWYFAADRSGVMPFCVLLEIALQPCGWLAAYAGSALRSSQDLKFRNLGGSAVLHRQVFPDCGTLTMRCRMTKTSEAAEMIIENFDFEVLAGGQPVYTGDTYFGFFAKPALAQQKGLGQADAMVRLLAEFSPAIDGACKLTSDPPWTPAEADGAALSVEGLRLPGKALLMIDEISAWLPSGGSQGLGYIRGTKRVDPNEWFFKAHFYQDPVCPGSLGLESFVQLMKTVAMERWPEAVKTHRFRLKTAARHNWSYRGQIIPQNRLVTVEATVTHVDDGPLRPRLKADGLLSVDGLPIYKMDGFELELIPAVVRRGA